MKPEQIPSGELRQDPSPTMDRSIGNGNGNKHSAKLEQIFTNLSHEGFMAFDLDCRYTYWSRRMEDIFGFSADEVIGRKASDLFVFLEQTGEIRFFLGTLRGESATSHSQPYQIPETGKSGFFDAYYYPCYSPSGAIEGGYAIICDVTEQKVERELRAETEVRFKNMADSSPVMLWMAGTDSLCNFFNQTWLDFTGRTLEQEWGVGWAEGIHPEDFQRCMDTYIAGFNERKSFEMEYRLLRRDGTYRWILDRGTPRYAPGGNFARGGFAGFIGSCVDITELKELEIELRKAVKVREDFLSIASHELKTPLTSLTLQLGIFEHLLSAGKDLSQFSQRVKAVVDVAGRQLGHLTDLIEKLLDVSRLSAGKLVLDRDEIDLVDVVGDIVERISENAKLAQCRLSVSSCPALKGSWDRSRLDQVFSNLIFNAIKYAPGSPIEIKVAAEGDQAIFEVRDHGPGIPPAYLSKVFEKFQRAGASHNAAGLGLGLFIAREIIHSHEGAITVESEQGKGACFRVALPLR